MMMSHIRVFFNGSLLGQLLALSMVQLLCIIEGKKDEILYGEIP
jgi:hypothetical protein